MRIYNRNRKHGKAAAITLFFLSLLFAPLHAQRKADRYYSTGEYSKAISLYEKKLRHTTDPVAMARLADCYRMTRNYEKAEQWYAQAVSGTVELEPITYFNYGMVLKSSNKPEKAKEQFDKYISKVPADKAAQVQVKSLADIRQWLSGKPMYAVKNTESVNSRESDFSPVFYKNGLLFISNRGARDLLNGDDDGATGKAYLSVYFTPIKGGGADSAAFGSAKKFSKKINKDFHNGPVSLTEDGSLMAFNRVDGIARSRGANKVNRVKIYFVQKKGNGWSAAEPFQYNSNDYSAAHPSLSHDGSVLYFSSDMPGGQGGKDIWMCRKEGNGWGRPENLGAELNTAGNEVFPCIRKDGMLYFSSDGHSGFGGLDIFSSGFENGKWTEITNQGSPLNAATDDFGITFNEQGSRGYFSSDRAGGKGADDVYSFTVTNKFLRIAGNILASKDPNDVMANTKVTLITEDGQVVKAANTDPKGGFQFTSLPSDKKYLMKLDDNDPLISGRKKYYMTDEKGNLVRVTVANGIGGKYTFENIPVDPNGLPQLLSDDDLLTIAGNLLSSGTPPQPLSNMAVNLVDDLGNVVQATTTNEFGAFTFTRLPPDKTYIVSLADPDMKLAANSKIIITNKSGKELMSTTPDNNGKFAFRILSSDRTTLQAMIVEDPDLRLDLRGTLVAGDGSNTLLPNTTMKILNEKGDLVQTVTTDSKGQFNFINLPADKSYIVMIDTEDNIKLAAYGKLYIKDEKGRVIKELRIGRSGKYELKVLPSDRNMLAFVYVDDPWLQVLQMKEKARKDSLLIIENIYYDYADWKILPAAEITLDKVARVMSLDQNIAIEISAHTDSRAKNDFNLQLSKKRAKTVVDYLVKRGVDASRLTSVGHGESKLLNKCSDGVECSEEEHAKNRRTEFKINRKQ
ncbi:MAG: OmpA/MotB domain-containing protein [Bacteroidetes bacterium]|nr:MAG: OmpA/MotB domain-containing protein [Bacteroidota bacterium]